MAVLENVVFAYVKIQQPAQKYETEGKENTEWTVDCIVSEKAAKEWKKKFRKQAPKEFDNEQFKEIFKIDPPYPDQDEQYVIKLKKPTHYEDKESGKMKPLDPKMRAKVFENINPEGNPKLVDVTKRKLIQNGSEGVVLYDVLDNKYGTFAKLKAIRVDKLLEYVAQDNVDELGEIVDDGGSEIEDPSDADFGSEESVDDSTEDDAPFDVEEDDDDY